MGIEARFDAETGTYVWGDPEPVVVPIEPAFIRESVAQDFEQRHDVTTFADTYPRGPKSISLAPQVKEEFDPLEDWRVPGDVADDILISLPDGTPRLLRTVLTLLIGAMRGGQRHS